MIISRTETVPITEASARGVSRLASDAAAGHPTVLARRNEPVAAVIGFTELQRLTELEHDLVDLALVLSRSATDTGNRTSLDDLITAAGFTREQLDAMPEPAGCE